MMGCRNTGYAKMFVCTKLCVLRYLCVLRCLYYNFVCIKMFISIKMFVYARIVAYNRMFTSKQSYLSPDSPDAWRYRLWYDLSICHHLGYRHSVHETIQVNIA